MPQRQRHNLGATSWPGDTWKIGGAAVWGWISYDPELNLIYHGTSNPGPWNGNQRPGDNKWSAAIIARDADTGEMVWAFQPTPHDIWDYDAVNENILVDLPIRRHDAEGARALRPQRLRVHDRSRDRRGASRQAVRADELVDRRRPQDRTADAQRRTRRRRRARR